VLGFSLCKLIYISLNSSGKNSSDSGIYAQSICLVSLLNPINKAPSPLSLFSLIIIWINSPIFFSIKLQYCSLESSIVNY